MAEVSDKRLDEAIEIIEGWNPTYFDALFGPFRGIASEKEMLKRKRNHVKAHWDELQPFVQYNQLARVAHPEYGVPEITSQEYAEKLKVVIRQAHADEGLTNAEIDKQYKDFYEDAVGKAKLSGVTSDLPFFPQIIEPMMEGFIAESEAAETLGGTQAGAAAQQNIWLNQMSQPPAKRLEEQGYVPRFQQGQFRGFGEPQLWEGRDVQDIVSGALQQKAVDQFEIERQMALGQFGGPEDWIQRWITERLPAPEKRGRSGRPWEAMSPRQRRDFLETTNLGTKTRIELEAGRLGKTWGVDRPIAPPMPRAEWLQAKAMEVSGDSGGDDEPRKPLAPETPEFLSRMIPGLTAGQPLRPLGRRPSRYIFGEGETQEIPERGRAPKLEATTPSPQQWMGLTPAQQSQWAGYVNWQGGLKSQPGQAQNLLGQMQAMIPGGTARTRRWQPMTRRT